MGLLKVVVGLLKVILEAIYSNVPNVVKEEIIDRW